VTGDLRSAAAALATHCGAQTVHIALPFR